MVIAMTKIESENQKMNFKQRTAYKNGYKIEIEIKIENENKIERKKKESSMGKSHDLYPG